MKYSREIRKHAKSIFRACFENGRLSEGRVRKAAQALVKTQPRKVTGILRGFKDLVQTEIDRNTVLVESAVALPDEGAAIFKQIEQKFGPALAAIYRLNPSLIGGLRIQVGSTVYDGSVSQRLTQLKT